MAASLYEQLDRECAEFVREHGHLTAAEHNFIAARLMEAAKNNPPPRAPLAVAHTEPD
ncbi:MAG: hypothetical protein AB7F74_11590 [Parvibaculaceae bacterium]